jgi:hypothetical protein
MNRSLTVAVAAGFAYILAIVACGLFIYHLTLLGIAFALATISAILCGLYVQFWEQTFGNQPKRSVPLMAALLSAAVIIFGAIQAKHSPDWRTFPNTALVFDVSDRAHPYSKLIAVDRDHSLLPITALAFIHILNERDVSMRIVGYSLEYASVLPGPWTRLCRIDLEPGHLIYFAFNDITKAIPIRLDRRIDQILRHGPVAPRDTISD